MSFSTTQSITRRGFLAGLAASLALPMSITTAANQADPITPFDLGHGLEVRDYRLFPTEDVMRFIVEIHNTTDTSVDTPAIGVTLPHIEELQNFGWANPASAVLHAHSSGCLIGVAPLAVKTDEDWGLPEWLLCDNIHTTKAESLQNFDIEYSQSTEILRDTRSRTTLRVTNQGSEIARGAMLQGLIRDREDRICGSLLPVNVWSVDPGTTEELSINLNESHQYNANPFALISSVEGLEFIFDLQPTGKILNSGCSRVMPWNR